MSNVRRSTVLRHGACGSNAYGGVLFGRGPGPITCTGCDNPPSWSDLLPEHGERIVSDPATGVLLVQHASVCDDCDGTRAVPALFPGEHTDNGLDPCPSCVVVTADGSTFVTAD